MLSAYWLPTERCMYANHYKQWEVQLPGVPKAFPKIDFLKQILPNGHCTVYVDSRRTGVYYYGLQQWTVLCAYTWKNSNMPEKQVQIQNGMASGWHGTISFYLSTHLEANCKTVFYGCHLLALGVKSWRNPILSREKNTMNFFPK